MCIRDSIYETQEVDAPRNKEAKWNLIFNQNRFLKCKSNAETKSLEVFSVCRWNGCTHNQDSVFDAVMHIGRVEMFLNDGRKRKFLYFQSDYEIRN